MKKLYPFLIALSLILFYSKTQAQYLQYEPAGKPAFTVNNGWYEASVSYQNQTTQFKANYTLNVKVENNFVTAIKFENGELHSGYNNFGYTWNGGTINYDKNFSGEITSIYSTVTIYQSGSIKIFNIYLK